MNPIQSLAFGKEQKWRQWIHLPDLASELDFCTREYVMGKVKNHGTM